MKRALPIFLTAMLLLMSCAVAEDGGANEPADHDIEQKLTQTYLRETPHSIQSPRNMIK